MDKFMKNLDDLERKLIKTNKIAAKGDDMKLGDAIKLGRKSNSIVSTIKKGIKEYETYNPTEAESKKVLEQMNRIVALSEEQVDKLVKNQTVMKDKLHIGGTTPQRLVKRNLAKTSEASCDLENLMLLKAPADLKPESEALVKRRRLAFEKGQSAYSNATGGEDQAEGEDDSD